MMKSPIKIKEKYDISDSTMKEKVLKPFWNKTTIEKSKKLWLPTKTDCVDLDLKSLSGSLKNTMLNSWFSLNLQKSQKIFPENQNLQPSLLQEIMGEDQQHIKKIGKKKRKKKKKKKSDLLRGKKYKVYPNEEQKKLIKNWLGAGRFVYNRCLFYIKEEYKNNKTNVLDIKILREKFINDSNYQTENKWMLDIPYNIKDEFLRDLLGNYKTNFAKGEVFSIKYKSKKNETQSLSVLSKDWNKTRGDYSKIFHSTNLKCDEKLPKHLGYSSRLITNKLGEYFLAIPRRVEKISKIHENQVDKEISLDPGVRTFQTGYDPNGFILNFCPNDIGNLSRLLHYKNKLISRMTKANHSAKQNIKKAILKSSRNIKNKVLDCHRKISLWLCQNYNRIYVPKLDFHTMKNLSKRNKAKLVVWSHCEFVDRLIDKSKEFLNCKVFVVTEEFTSKTCGCCGEINKELGSSKTFSCNKCKSVFDRDANGSRNILLKSR